MSTPARIAASFIVTGAAIAGGVMSVDRVRPDSTPMAAESHRLIDLNSAPAGELELLPRIGPALAARIIEDRLANGPFRSVDDLQRVRGIGPVTVRRIEELAEARPID